MKRGRTACFTIPTLETLFWPSLLVCLSGARRYISSSILYTKAHSRQYSNPFVPSAAGSIRADSPAPSRTASPAPLRDREDFQHSQHSQPRRPRLSGSGSGNAALTVRPTTAGAVAQRDAGPQRSRTLDSRDRAMAAEKNSRMTTERSRSFSTTHDGSMTTVHAHHSYSRSHSHSQNLWMSLKGCGVWGGVAYPRSPCSPNGEGAVVEEFVGEYYV